jgi:nitric oxide reductase subunit B
LTPANKTLFWQWMRPPGDVVFALGALLMAWVFLRQISPFRSGVHAPEFGDESVARPASTPAE